MQPLKNLLASPGKTARERLSFPQLILMSRAEFLVGLFFVRRPIATVNPALGGMYSDTATQRPNNEQARFYLPPRASAQQNTQVTTYCAAPCIAHRVPPKCMPSPNLAGPAILRPGQRPMLPLRPCVALTTVPA